MEFYRFMHLRFFPGYSSRALPKISCIVVFAATLLVISTASANYSLTELRTSYIEANQFLNKGSINRWLKIRPRLKNYPLFPYLKLKEIRATQSQFSNSEISRVISEIDIPVPSSFKSWWLNRLVARNDWELIIKHYENSSNPKTHCLRARGMIKTGQIEKAVPLIHKLWLVNTSQPKRCDSVFEYGFRHNIINDDLIWKRMLLTKARNNSSLTKYLAGLLDSKESKTWAKWLNVVHRNPQANIQKNFSDWSESAYGQNVIQHGITRMARRDVGKTAEFWRHLKKTDPAATERLPNISKIIAVRLAYEQHQDAYDWLTELPAVSHDIKSLHLILKSALAVENWDGVLKTLSLLPEPEANRSQWIFWRARALHETGEESQAQELWSSISTERSYYGFLAADRLNATYPIYKPAQPINLQEASINAMAVPAMPRIREWLALSKPYYARRELNQLKKSQLHDENFWLHATVLFHYWQWHDGAIQTSYRSGQRDSFQLNVTHPSPFIEYVRRESVRYGVPEHWIYAIMHQESSFIHDIRSGKGATGLMQLMLSTARITAKRHGLRKPSKSDLQVAATNIRLGVAYFKQLLDAMDNNPVYALAGYNAGPRRSMRWQESFRASDPAIWVETVTFNETQKYIKKILVNFVIYESIHSSTRSRVRDYLQIPEIQQASSTE